MFISIHAPVWGATTSIEFASRSMSISIHAPVWGATDEVNFFDDFIKISIHAPVWGATSLDNTGFRGGKRFQFTLPCGERLKQGVMENEKINFNSRSRVGSDL